MGKKIEYHHERNITLPFGAPGPRGFYFYSYSFFMCFIIPHIVSMGFLLLDQRRRLTHTLTLTPSSRPYMLCTDMSYTDKPYTDMSFTAMSYAEMSDRYVIHNYVIHSYVRQICHTQICHIQVCHTQSILGLPRGGGGGWVHRSPPVFLEKYGFMFSKC